MVDFGPIGAFVINREELERCADDYNRCQLAVDTTALELAAAELSVDRLRTKLKVLQSDLQSSRDALREFLAPAIG